MVDFIMLVVIVISVLGVGVTILMICIVAGGTTLELVRFHRDALDNERRRKGLCVRCGYDLRGSPRRCPECGRPVRAALTPRFLPQ